MQPLLVIVPDKLSDLVKKGEYPPRYYNPGNLFEEVHILTTCDDKVNPALMQRTVGNAKLYIHYLPARRILFLQSFGWRPSLLKGWAERAVALARENRPVFVRCYGNYLNAYLALRIKDVFGVPYVVSLHTNPAETLRRMSSSWKQFINAYAMIAVERAALKNSDMVLPVYESIVPYVNSMGARHCEVIYNSLNRDHLKRKDSYALHIPIHIVSVGRQCKGKNTENLIRAVKELNKAQLTLIGDGSYHAHLRAVAHECRIEDRVVFVPSISNDTLCSQLADYDIFATHSDYWECAKAVMEPLSVGLPVVINKRQGQPVPEYQGDFLLLVDNTVDGYLQALTRLIEDNSFRENLGRKACVYAQQKWAPEKMETKIVEIYKTMMSKAEK